MRYRTAVILSVVLVGGMFVVPAVIEPIFLPSLQRGIPNPVPLYEQHLLLISEFCIRWRLILALPITAVLFAIAAITGGGRSRAA